ncbi:MAG: extracellular solute-binding protein, partial [Candidatus Hydrogenedentes bacterium]|nr:extracellular solute-binding protein [Candidatus Hydrogenedentota bacterium]
ALQGGDLDPFMTGKIAMKIDGDYVIQTIANTKRDLRFGVALAPAPEGKKQIGWCGGWAWIIPRGAKHPEEAWEFIKYLASQRAYEIRSDSIRQQTRAAGNVFIPNMSARKDVTDWAMQHYLFSDPTIDEKFKVTKKVFVDAMPISRYRPVTPVGQLLWNEQVRAMERGYYKKYDSTDPRRNAQMAADESTKAVQAELDRLFKPVPHPVLSWTPIVITYVVLLVGGFLFMFWFFDRREKVRGYFRQEHYAGYLFAAPWFVGFIVFGGGPIVFSLFISFCQYDVLSPPQFVGLRNYTEMFSSQNSFYAPLMNTLFMTIGVPASMAVGLGIAMLLSSEIKGMAVYRTFFYMPSIMPAVAAAILWLWIFNPQQGILNTALGAIGVPGPGWLTEKLWAKPAIVLMGLWGAGGGMIVWLAGLKGIPVHLYEAAELDGAGKLRQFWSITIPMLSPYIFFNLIMGLIGTFKIFEVAFIMTHGGPDDATLFYAYELFNNAFRYMKMGYASAMAWVLFGIILFLTVIQLKLAPRWVHYESEE